MDAEPSQPELLILRQRRPRGRPRVEEPRTAVMTWVPVSTHEKLCELAKRHDVSISALVRQFLTLRVKK